MSMGLNWVDYLLITGVIKSLLGFYSYVAILTFMGETFQDYICLEYIYFYESVWSGHRFKAIKYLPD